MQQLFIHLIYQQNLIWLVFNKVDKDVDKLKTLLVNLSKLSNVVENDFVKETVYDKFVKKVNVIQTINTSDSVKKADYNT